MNEIGEREKIDIINWSDNAQEYIREALSPAEVVKVEINDKKAKVFVSEDQQSIAIGRQGQNVRLASKLTGFDIDIELAKAPEKKKRKNAEDSLLNALSETSDDDNATIETQDVADPVESTQPEAKTEENDFVEPTDSVDKDLNQDVKVDNDKLASTEVE